MFFWAQLLEQIKMIKLILGQMKKIAELKNPASIISFIKRFIILCDIVGLQQQKLRNPSLFFWSLSFAEYYSLASQLHTGHHNSFSVDTSDKLLLEKPQWYSSAIIDRKIM